MHQPVSVGAGERSGAPRTLLPAICSAAFVVFAQTFMVAPLIPHLSAVFASPITWVALAIPAYIVPQGLMTLLAGPLSVRIDVFIAWRVAAVGALLEPLIGWHGLFLAVAALSAAVIIFALITGAFPRLALPATPPPWRIVARGYATLLSQARARRTYGYVLLNAILQSGVFTWLGVYLHQRFGLGETGIGLALLGYGIPGLLFGPIIGKLADRYGRAWIVPAGVALTGVCALLLALGFDLTHPQLAAIATDLHGPRGQAVALMAFSLFVGFGLGSLLFQAALTGGFVVALCVFGSCALVAAAIALVLFRDERPSHAKFQARPERP